MRLGSLIVAGLAAVASAIPAKEVVENINAITMKSRDLQVPAKSVSVRDAALIAIGQGNYPTIIIGFRDIIVTGENALREMNPEKYTGNDADIIFDAFREFVMVHQALLNILIGKAGLFEKVPLIGEPVSAVLRALEGVVDALAFSLIDMAEDQAADLLSQANALGMTLDLCIEKYSSLI